MTGELAQPGPRRVPRLRDLLFHGIVPITPIAPVGVFGVASNLSHGHAPLPFCSPWPP